jgi:hypothetical protein
MNILSLDTLRSYMMKIKNSHVIFIFIYLLSLILEFIALFIFKINNLCDLMLNNL